MVRTVMIDNREKNRIQQAMRHFDNDRYIGEVAQLDVGDYVCGNCCIEYKITSDFIDSVKNKRIFKQANRMDEYYDNHYVFIETEYRQMKDAIHNSWYRKKPFSWKQYYGALASLCQITKPIIVHNFDESLRFMDRLFEKSNDGKIRNVVPSAKKYDNFLVNCLSSIEGIGGNTALLIIDSLDLNTYRELCDITEDDLVRIKGIGRKTAHIIMEKIGQ